MMTRSLLLKGLAGVAAVGGTVGGLAFYGKEIFGGKKVEGGTGAVVEVKENENLDSFTHKQLIDKVGLSCGLTDEETEVTNTSKDCTVKEGGTINVKRGEQEKEEGVKYSDSSSKLKVSRSGGYSRDLKFVVDSGDLQLTKDGGSSSIQKLEQFETYEIKKEGDKFYLSRRTEAKEGKKDALGLGECTLPEAGANNQPCTFEKQENIKKIRFEGHEEGITVSDGSSVSLKVTKMGDSDSDFGDDKYRFTFTFPSDVSINTKSLKANIPYDFKIKKGTGNSLTLEQAWTDNNVFTKKAGLDCKDTSGCTVPADSQNLNVKVGTKTKEGITSLNGGNGKIKMETDQPGYNQGLKFTITTADVTLTGGTPSGGSEDITKLEELETYEITEEGGKYYLTRKTSKDESIKSSLVLPQGCDLPTGTEDKTCTLTADDFKNINFESKSEASASGNISLKISKATNTTDFPLGYKFTFNTTSDATIKTGNTIKANIPTDFKIKKNEGKVSLEKAWDDTKFSFAEKAAMTCDTSKNECSSKSDASEKLNVKKGNDTKTGITGINGSESGKIKVEKDQAGYNQGLKFTITGGDVSLTGGSGSGNIQKLEELETYEITEDGGKYYLTRKTEAIKTIESLLGLADAGCSLSGTSSSCSNLTSEKLQKIKFDGKESGKPTISSGTATLTISKADSTDFPLGYKFTLKSTSGDITIKTGNVVKQNISTDFKIKKSTSTPTTLTLEKAWDMTTLGKKVGLTCNNASTNECTIDNSNSNKLRVKQQDKGGNDVEQTTLNKGTGSGCSISGKIKVTKDQKDYNQGFKFKIEGGNINLTGSSGSDDSSKVHRLGEFETYEIKDEGTKGWFLVRKDRADDFIKKQLKLDGGVCSEYEKFPHSSSGAGTTCNNITDVSKLKNINFEAKDKHTDNWPKGSIDVSLEIKHDSSLPGGFKFTFTNNGGDNVCLPTGTDGGKVDLQKSSGTVEYKIKRTGTGEGLKLSLEKKDNGGSGSCSS